VIINIKVVTHDPCHMFDKLTKLILVFLSIFLIDIYIYFNFFIQHLQHLFYYELGFVIYFNLFLWSYLSLLIQVTGFLSNSGKLRFFYCIFFRLNFFYNFIIQQWVYWELNFIIYFNLVYHGLIIRVVDLESWLRLIQYVVISIFFKKQMSLWIFF
jgi:hypothetical protein